MKNRIKNFNELATTKNRRLALSIVEAGLESIDTEEVISNSIKIEDNILSVMDKKFNLSKFKKIKVVGFGKASIDAAVALERIFGSKIKEGAVVGLHRIDLQYIGTFVGTHPKPSQMNVIAGEKIYEIIKDSTAEDLIIALVSGGGSALLCYSQNECEQNISLYNEFLKSGKTITEINTVRKHLSILKGGGLVKIAYPATVIGLIFSDIPGDNFADVASGPTYKDKTTVNDAEKIIAENNLGDFDLLETPKEDKYFEKVYNFVLVSNRKALEAMEQKSKELGLMTKIVSDEIYDEISVALKRISVVKENNTVVLAAGEPAVEVKDKGGKGGRNLHMGLEMTKMIDKKDFQDSVFVSFASDGMDNSDVAGAIVDKSTLEKSKKLNLNIDDYLTRFDSYDFFQKSGDLIITGETGANVSDLMILLTKNEEL
jgi:glycerate 2-kinase